MYYCEDCKNEFENPTREKTCFETFYGVDNLFNTQHYFDLLKCPFCGSEEIEKMKRCDRCEEWTREEDLQDTEEAINGGIGYLCLDCIKDCEIKFI